MSVMTVVTDSPSVNPNAERPRVIVTRRLLPSVEARMGELFDTLLNTDDTVLSREALIAAMRDCDVLVP